MKEPMDEEELKFTTPTINKTIAAVKRAAVGSTVDSPFVIPPSPFMKRLGCGTHVTVYRYDYYYNY